MRKSRKILTFGLFLVLLTGCTLLDNYMEEEEQWTDQSHIDFLYGVEESGKLKVEAHFYSTDDDEVDSEVEFIYEGSNLIEKTFKDYNWGDPVIMQRDTFIYEASSLLSRLSYLRKDSPENPMDLNAIHNYYYPDENTKVKVEYEYTGRSSDSIVYVYENKQIIEERRYNASGFQRLTYVYNQQGKPLSVQDHTTGVITINTFNDAGLLENTTVFQDEEILLELSYTRKQKQNVLTIERYLKYGVMNEPSLNSVKIFEDARLIEWVEHRSSASGSEWWSTRYEYF